MAKGYKTGGRQQGAENKFDSKARAAIAAIADGMALEFVEWVRKVAAEKPKEAAEIWLKAIEYHIPKLARTEVKNADDQPFKVEHDVTSRVLAQLSTEQIEAALADIKNHK